MDSVRAADTSTCKKGVPDWLLEDPVDKLEPPLPNKKEKIHRGLAHPAFARALTPMVWEANERYRFFVSTAAYSPVSVHGQKSSRARSRSLPTSSPFLSSPALRSSPSTRTWRILLGVRCLKMPAKAKSCYGYVAV
jgi:hypothetical protein